MTKYLAMLFLVLSSQCHAYEALLVEDSIACPQLKQLTTAKLSNCFVTRQVYVVYLVKEIQQGGVRYWLVEDGAGKMYYTESKNVVSKY